MTRLFFSDRRTQAKTKQQKKHHTQMTNDELSLCLDLLRENFNNIEFTGHFKKKRQVHFNTKSIYNSIKKDSFTKNIIEYNVTKDSNGLREQRLLIRHPEVVLVDNEACYQYFVYSLTKKQVITIYYNLVSDKRETFDISYYCEDLQITRNFKG